MVRCINCAYLIRSTRRCKAYNVTIKLSDVHRQMSCPRYKPKWVVEVKT